MLPAILVMAEDFRISLENSDDFADQVVEVKGIAAAQSRFVIFKNQPDNFLKFAGRWRCFPPLVFYLGNFSGDGKRIKFFFWQIEIGKNRFNQAERIVFVKNGKSAGSAGQLGLIFKNLDAKRVKGADKW